MSSPDPAGHAANSNTLGKQAHITGPVIQAGGIHGSVHVHQPGPVPWPTPKQLLPAPAHFVDREDVLAALRSLRRADAPWPVAVVNVHGPSGMGKTALATLFLRELAAAGEFPEGQMYADLRGHPPDQSALSTSEVLGRFLRAFRIGPELPADAEERAALWRSVTAEGRVGVLVDNAARAEDVRPLLPGGCASLVVVTSRHPLDGLMTEGALFCALAPLPDAAAARLLTRYAGRAADEPAATTRLAALCAGIPLALVVAGAHLAADGDGAISAAATALAARPRPAAPSPQEAAISAVLDHMYTRLSSEAAHAYRNIGALPHLRSFGTHEVAAACGLASANALENAAALIETLTSHRLAERLDADGHRWRLHDAVHPHAAARARRVDGEAACAAAVRRWVEHLLRAATAAEELLSPSHRTLDRDYRYEQALPLPFPGAEPAALAWLEERLPDLMAAVHAAFAAGWWGTTWQLVDALWPVFLRRRHYDLWVHAHCDVGLPAARRAGHRAGERRMLTSGAAGLRHLARYDEALDCHRQALHSARADGNRRDEAQSLHGTGDIYHLQGRYDQAHDHLLRALALRERIGYGRGAALSRILLGDLAIVRRGFDDAIGHLTRAHAALLAEGDRYDAARAQAFLARAHAGRGDDARAAGLFGQAIREFEATGAPSWQARTLEWLGESHQAHGRVADARASYEQALHLYRPVSTRDADRVRARLRAVAPHGNGEGP